MNDIIFSIASILISIAIISYVVITSRPKKGKE